MSSSSRPRAEAASSALRLFRIAVALPALLTAVLLVSRFFPGRAGETPEPGSLELTLSEGAQEIALPPFGAPIPEVTSAGDAVEVDDGWVVLDHRSQQLVLLSRDGHLLGVRGRPGDGPGELRGAAHVAVLGPTIAVVDRAGESVHLFELDGTFRSRVPLTAPRCLAAPVENVASQGGRLVLLRRCMRSGMQMSAIVDRLDENGAWERLAEVPLAIRSGIEAPLLAAADGRIWLGITPDRCVESIPDGGGDATHLCYPDVEGPRLSESLEGAFAEMERSAAEAGVRVDVPERYPPFVELLDVGNHLGFLVPLDESRGAMDVWAGGERLRRILLPQDVAVFFGPTSMLFVQEGVTGTAFSVRPLP